MYRGMLANLLLSDSSGAVLFAFWAMHYQPDILGGARFPDDAFAEPFDPARTLFVDDSLPVLRSAHAYGIRHLLAILEPDTRQARRRVDEFPAVRGFGELLPGLRALVE